MHTDILERPWLDLPSTAGVDALKQAVFAVQAIYRAIVWLHLVNLTGATIPHFGHP